VLEDDFPEALVHLERAHALQPNDPDTLNNLAWALAYQEEPDLERALTLCDQALKLRPRDHRIRETRGQILAKLGRHEDAIVDLESALGRRERDREIHETLAKLYDALGDSELAETHRRLSRAK
jgi:Flp pilus assembly protein TadD